MKNLIFQTTIIISLLVLGCKPSKLKKLNPQEAIITYSKSRCFGRCPVYDLYIFDDGKVLYSGIENVSKIGNHESSISQQELGEIKSLLNNIDLKSNQNQLVRDMPVTTLIFNGDKITYNETKIPEDFQAINNLIKNIKRKIE